MYLLITHFFCAHTQTNWLTWPSALPKESINSKTSGINVNLLLCLITQTNSNFGCCSRQNHQAKQVLFRFFSSYFRSHLLADALLQRHVSRSRRSIRPRVQAPRLVFSSVWSLRTSQEARRLECRKITRDHTKTSISRMDCLPCRTIPWRLRIHHPRTPKVKNEEAQSCGKWSWPVCRWIFAGVLDPVGEVPLSWPENKARS